MLGRVTAAGDAAARLADAVAVLGAARLHDATSLAALGEAEGVAAADRLAAADVLTSGAHVRFVHPIARQAIRAHIPPAGSPWPTPAPRGCFPTGDRGTPLDHVADLASRDDAVVVVQAEDRLSFELHPALETKVRPVFMLGDYETAAFAAMKRVEVRVRELSGEPADVVGVALMRKAFGERGPLTTRRRPEASRLPSWTCLRVRSAP